MREDPTRLRPSDVPVLLGDHSKFTERTGWKPSIPFEQGIRETILWYRDNPEWWTHVKSGEYQTYYNIYYKETLKENV